MFPGRMPLVIAHGTFVPGLSVGKPVLIWDIAGLGLDTRILHYSRAESQLTWVGH